MTLTNQEIRSQYRNGLRTSMYRGVVMHSRDKKWCASIMYQGKKIWLGYFKSQSAAARAYDKKVIELYGTHNEHKLLNFELNAHDDFWGKPKKKSLVDKVLGALYHLITKTIKRIL